jgi:GntR family transcriptional regulator
MADPTLDLPSDSGSPGVPLDGPLYKDVKRQLMEVLTRGEWKAGEAIPSERRLAERYGISIGTVRKAIDELVAENILIRQQGRGTYVASHNRDRLLFYFFHIVPEQGPKEYPEIRLLSYAKAKADRVAALRLAIEPGDPVLRIRNVLSLGGAPVIIDDLTLPAACFRGLTEKRFRDRPSTIYNLYQEAFGVSVVRTSERLRAVVADAETAALLGLVPNAPLLQIRRLALTYNDVPVELRVSLVNTAHYEYFSDIGRN